MNSLYKKTDHSKTVILAVDSSVVEGASASPSSFYRPELDSLRFSAFLAVFIHHSFPKTTDFYQAHHLPAWLKNIPYAGAFGVDLFYCLSAYLITELLVREKSLVGHLNVKAFYVRRALRIWPLYFTFVLFAYALTFVDRTQVFPTSYLAMFVLLLGNWAVIGGAIHSIVLPLWSVSFEEQFYLLWPLVIRKASRRQMLSACILMIGIAYVWRAIITMAVKDGERAHALIWNGTFGHLDSIGYGIVISLIGAVGPISLWMRMSMLFLGGSAWLIAATLQDRGDFMMAFAALGSAAILRAAIGFTKLQNPMIVRLGVVSYGLYVYHEFFLQYFDRLLPSGIRHNPRFALWWALSLAGTIVAALVSYRWLESPFLRLTGRFTIVKSRPA